MITLGVLMLEVLRPNRRARTPEMYLCVCALLIAAACAKTREAELAQDSALVRTNSAPGEIQEPAAVARAAPPASDTSFHEEWIPGRVWETSKGQSRFLARMRPLSNGQMLLRLDTAAVRPRQGVASSTFVAVDSAIVSADTPVGENFTTYCAIGGKAADGQVAGLIQTIVMGESERPRAAWMFDTVAVRIRSVVTESVTCLHPERT